MSNIKLAPSLLAANFLNLAQDITAAEQAGCEYLHFDVMDGVFVGNISFGLPILESIKAHTSMVMDCHLMIVKPSQYLKAFADAGADIITFHVEVDEDIQANIDTIKSLGKKAGLAINPKTDPNLLLPYLHSIDMITVMTVQAGFGGQSFMPEVVPNIELFSNYIKANGLNVDIQVDGGINLSTVDSVLGAGANVIVAGSAIFGASDIAGAVSNFRAKF